MSFYVDIKFITYWFSERCR